MREIQGLNDSKARMLSTVEISLEYSCGPCPKNIRWFWARVFFTTYFLFFCPYLPLIIFIMETIYGHLRKIRKLDKQKKFVNSSGIISIIYHLLPQIFFYAKNIHQCRLFFNIRQIYK